MKSKWFLKYGKCSFIFILILAISKAMVVSADEPVMPQFKAPPQKYEYRHEISRVGSPLPDTVVDELLIGDVTDKELKFYFYLIGNNGHICGGSGVATYRDGFYYYAAPSVREVYEQGKIKRKKVECRLRIQLDSKQVSLKDEDGNCKQMFCGKRAHIGDTYFRRVP